MAFYDLSKNTVSIIQVVNIISKGDEKLRSQPNKITALINVVKL